VFAILNTFLVTSTAAGVKLLVEPNKTVLLYLDHSASVVTVNNPKIADVDVQSPRMILVLGKSVGVTKINIITSARRKALVYDVTVTPWIDNKVTINLGAEAVKTLKCQPRCIRMDNPGKDPEAGKGGGGGKTGGGLPPTFTANR
jgi:hypothetical protein